MCSIYKCPDKETLESYIQGWKPYLDVFVSHRNSPINYTRYDGGFPCYLICDFSYPACGLDSVHISIIAGIDDLEAEAER